MHKHEENKVVGTPKEILEGKPLGATHYAVLDGMVIYLFKSSYGFRQIKGNLIGFHCTGIPAFDIKELT